MILCGDGMVRIAVLAAMLMASSSRATDYPATGTLQRTLTIYSTTDTAVFEPVIQQYQREHGGIAVRYEELEGSALYSRFLRDADRKAGRADLLLSASMDLQVKLVNDGYAAAHESDNARALPAWARWRNQAFGFTFEPSVMVFNRAAFKNRVPPKSRGELIRLLRAERNDWRGRVGTYDIGQSGVGYLLATQDSRQSSEFAALIEALAEARVRIETRTSALLDKLETGDLAIGYNLLGSYAERRIAAGAPLIAVYPRDFTLAVTRTAVIPANAPNAAAAHSFLEYLLSIRGQEILASHGRLPAVRREVAGRYSQLGIIDATVGPLRPIVLGPGLLVYLDAQKRSRFIDNWYGIILPHPAPPARPVPSAARP